MKSLQGRFPQTKKQAKPCFQQFSCTRTMKLPQCEQRRQRVKWTRNWKTWVTKYWILEFQTYLEKLCLPACGQNIIATENRTTRKRQHKQKSLRNEAVQNVGISLRCAKLAYKSRSNYCRKSCSAGHVAKHILNDQNQKSERWIHGHTTILEKPIARPMAAL